MRDTKGTQRAALAVSRQMDELALAWREVQSHASVRLSRIGSARHYAAMKVLMKALLGTVKGRTSHPLAGLLEAVTLFVRDYEERHVVPTKASPAAVLRYLMDQRKMRQVDLADLFGSQSHVSEALRGEREIDVRQARALSKRFAVPAGVFI